MIHQQVGVVGCWERVLKLPIHYIGTDVNTENKGCYESLGEFYHKHVIKRTPTRFIM